MNKITAQEGPYITLIEAVPGALDNKEDHLLSLDAAGKAVLFTGAAPAFAVMVGKLQAGETEVRARMLGKGGTVRVIQDAPIALGARVAGKAGTARVETAAAGARSLGFKIGLAAGAQGDVIEIADVVEPAAIPTALANPGAATSTDGVAAAAVPAAMTYAAPDAGAVNSGDAGTDAVIASLRTQLIALAADVTAIHAAALLAQAEGELIGDDARAALAAADATITALKTQNVLS